MAADELRRRVNESLGGRFGATVNAVAERARINPQTLAMFMKTPARGVDAETARKLAAHFHWPEEDVFRWAELMSPIPERDSAAAVHGALTNGNWPPDVREALYILAEHTAKNSATVEPAELRAKVEHAADKALRPFAAKRKQLFSPEEVRSLMTGHFLFLLQEEFSGVGGAS